MTLHRGKIKGAEKQRQTDRHMLKNTESKEERGTHTHTHKERGTYAQRDIRQTYSGDKIRDR